MDPRENDGETRALRLGSRLLLVVAAVFTFGAQLRWLDDPFDHSAAGEISAMYAVSARAFRDHGFASLRAAPTVFILTGSPETQVPYLNHPGWPHFVFQAFFRFCGGDERSLRIPVLVVFALAAWALRSTVRRAASDVAANLTAALFLLVPASIFYGRLVDAFTLNLALIVLGVGAWVRLRREAAGGGYATFFVTATALGLADWIGFLLAPILLIDLLFETRRSFAREVAKLAAPFALALAADLGWLAYAAGGIGRAAEVMRLLFLVPSGGDLAQSDYMPKGGYLGQAVEWIGGALSWPFVAAAVVGWSAAIIRVARRRAVPLDRPLLLLLAAGLLPLLVFWSRAATIEFWFLLLAPAVALGVFSFWRDLGARTGRAMAPLLMIGCLGFGVVGAVGGLALHRRWSTDRWVERARVLNERFGEGDVLLFDRDVGAAGFYLDFALVPAVGSEVLAKEAARRLEPAAARIERLYFGCPKEALAVNAWAIGLPRLSTPPFTCRFDGGEALFVELDRAKFFGR